MSATERVVEVDQRGTFSSFVARYPDGRLELDMLVASGHMDRGCSFPITEAHLAVLRADDRRYLFLFAALHRPFQLRETELDDDEVRCYLDTVLLAPEPDAAEFLTALDHGAANGAISNVASIFGRTLGIDRLELRQGRWF